MAAQRARGAGREACLAIAAGILCRATTPAALLLSVLVALVIWVFGENFGGLLTGQATDPNTGPLLILLAVAYWPGQETNCSPPSMSYVAPVSAVLIMMCTASAATSAGVTTRPIGSFDRSSARRASS